MASKQIQCEMCCKENAVGYCKSCGYVGESCLDIHKIGKVFQTHNFTMNEENNENLKVTKRDITEERCKHHPCERAIFLCNIHDSMICGRCLHSEHLSCGKEVIDLLREVVNIDCEKVNTMKSVLMEIKNEIMLLKDDAEHSKENYKKNADKCLHECMELGNKIKRRVDDLINGIRDRITATHNENFTTHSRIFKTCDEKTRWIDNEESKIDNFVDNNMARHLYLMSRHFAKEVSDARSHLKEIKHRHSFKGIDFKVNKVVLKCLFEDLEDVCELQEEVTGSDYENANDVVASTTKINKSRRELIALLNQIKQDLDKSEKTRTAMCDDLQRVKQDLDNSEKKRKSLEQELLKAKQGIEEAKKETATLRAYIVENCNWTQPTGTVEVKTYARKIIMDFTFPDGIQATHNPSPGTPIKGGTFTGCLYRNSEGELLCRMLKAAFRRGMMFKLGMEGKNVLNGVSLYDRGPTEFSTATAMKKVKDRYQYLINSLPNRNTAYDRYVQTLKAELAAKGITEANIDWTEKLEGTFTVDG